MTRELIISTFEDEGAPGVVADEIIPIVDLARRTRFDATSAHEVLSGAEELAR